MTAAMDRALSSLSKLRAKSSKDLASISQSLSRDYPSDPACYELLEDCGRGVSATVHRAYCKTSEEIVAVKKMNLERVNMKLEDIIHEAQTMKSYHHPNVLSLYTSFVHGQDLWMVTPFMSGGSVLHIMKYRFPKGLDEVSIATIMKYVLLGLEYVHKNGGIHRDVKAGNILMDKDGVVRIGDFGVAATPAARDGDWCDAKNQQRTTFVGTPCWMAPEVMEQVEYNSRADIWSVGITMLEMANGHAPFAKFPPMKVLLMTLQGPAPQLDDQPGRPHFSKHMRNVIARCLQKDPAMRPTATELLQDKFFKQARDEEYLQNLLLCELPALGERVQMIREGKAATNAAENDRQLERSQEEYKRGVSMWNFDVASLKAQAALDDGGGAPGLASIAEEPQQIVEGEGSGSSSRRSTDEAAGISPVATPAAAAAAGAAAALAAGTAAAPAAAGAVQAQQQQQPAEVLQQQLPPLSVPSLPRIPSLGKDVVQQQQAQQQAQQQQPLQPLQHVQSDVAQQQQQQQQEQQQQQQQVNMRRAASAFAGSHELAAAVAEMGGGVGSSSSSGPGLLSHHSEPASQAVSHQGSGIPGQQASGSGMPPPAPYAGAAYTGLSSGSLAGAGASSGGSSYCLSPPNTSPPMSRESSSQGPLSSLATPEALQLRGKSKGRFQVYEHGVPAPPLSPGTRFGSLSEGLSGSFSKGTPTAAAAAAAVLAADGTSAAAPGTAVNLARVSDPAGVQSETPRAGRQVLNPAEAAELKAAAVAATAAAGTTGGGAPPAPGAPAAAATPGAAGAGTTPPAANAPGDATGGAGGTSTCPTPPPGTAAGAAAAAAAATAAAAGAAGAELNLPTGTSVSIDEAPSAAPEPKKKGRFKIIQEENVSRAPSKVSSSADLAAAARAGAGSGRSLTSASGVLPELLRLHEQSVVHANALARVIDSVRASCSGGNLVGAEELMVPGVTGVGTAGAAAAGTLPPRKPAAGVGTGGSGSGVPAGVLSRVNSGRGLAVLESKVVSLQQLLQEANGDPMELAERLYDRVQDLERQVSGLEVDLTRLRSPELRLRLLEGSGGSATISTAPSGLLESMEPSRAASRRASIAQLSLSAASPTAAAAAAAAAGCGGGSNGGGGVERHSSSGASGGGAEGGPGSGGGAGSTTPAPGGS